MKPGYISAIKDLIVHVEFNDGMPAIGELLIVQNKLKSPLLVDNLLDENTAICINIRSNKDIEKKMLVERTGKGYGNQRVLGIEEDGLDCRHSAQHLGLRGRT